MATDYTRPTFDTLISRIKGDFASRTQGSPYIKRSVEYVLSFVLGALANGMHGHFDWLRKQLLPTTCGIDGLLAWGVILKLPRKGALPSSGPATFTGTNGVDLEAGAVLQDEEGNAFTVTEGGTVADGEVEVEVEASEGGSAGNLDAGAKLSLVVPVPGIDTDGVVGEDGLEGGRDLEEVEDYRDRILEEFRVPPSGGGPGDYVRWAKESLATRAWEFGKRMGNGTVSLAFVIDGRADPIPTEEEVDQVQAYIEDIMPDDMRALYVQAPVAVPVDMTIALRPNTSAVRTAVRASLKELFEDEDENKLETELPQSVVDGAITNTDGETAHEITSITSLDPGTWGLLTLGDVTFTTL